MRVGRKAYAQILKKVNTLTDFQKNGLSIIHQCGEHLLNLINDILNISKIEARKMELHLRNLHFSEFLEGIAGICRIRAEQKGIELIYETLTSLPIAIRADDKRLRQVLLNLLGNAVKFTETGSVSFKVGYHEEKFRFQVEDTGVGIAPEQLAEVFLPFQQVGDRPEETEGTGLGMAISRQLVQLMGSELQVKSTLGQGSVFWFDLDLSEVSYWDNTANLLEQQIIGFTGEKRKVLVVDDKWANRSVLVHFLEPLGFEVVEAADGLEGVNKARELQPHVIFMDLVLPVMDGFEATRQIKKLPELAAVVVIAISASVFDFDQQQSWEVGCDDFLPKPVREVDLLEKLRVHLGLEWVYEEQGNRGQASQDAGLNPQGPLVAPPQQEMAVLLDLAKRGNLRGITDAATRLAAMDAQWVPFATHLRLLAKAFKVRQIQEFIKQHQRDE